MGLFSLLTGSHDEGDGHHEWPEEFDRRMASGAKVDKNMSGRPRVQDSAGNWFTREGKSCCGCGFNRNREGVDVDLDDGIVVSRANPKPRLF